MERLPPLVPRRYRFEVRERVTYDGKVLQPLDREQASRVAREIRRLGIESVAVCFLHSYANSAHEKIVGRILRGVFPKLHVSLSSELLPEFREYERTCTTVVNACLQPLISKYLNRLVDGLRALGIRAPVFVMQSNGGTLSSEQASREPARIIESGPVAGAVASRAYGKKVGASEIISLDVGGTTAKAGVWSRDQFEVTTEYEVGGRFHGLGRVEGSGYPVRFPFVDLVEVGIGGGGLAWVDGAGILHVGPKSAGASPGPACYGLGGNDATLTDANLVLGRLNPDYLLGGELRLRRELAEKAISDQVARPLALNLTEAAAGILRIAIANIAGALKAATVERGRDPRKMTLVAFGGAGPMHACEIAQQLEIRRVLVPPGAGLFSSLGLLLTDPVHDFVRTVLTPTSSPDYQRLTSIFLEMEDRARGLLRTEGVDVRDNIHRRFLDMRYQGQAYELSIPIPTKSVDRRVMVDATRNFHRMHEERYGYSDANGSVELVNLRSYSRGLTAGEMPRPQPVMRGRSALRTRREVYMNGRVIQHCRVFERSAMRPGLKGKGPCVVEDYDSTLVIPSRVRYEIDGTGSFRITL